MKSRLPPGPRTSTLENCEPLALLPLLNRAYHKKTFIEKYKGFGYRLAFFMSMSEFVILCYSQVLGGGQGRKKNIGWESGKGFMGKLEGNCCTQPRDAP